MVYGGSGGLACYFIEIVCLGMDVVGSCMVLFSVVKIVRGMKRVGL